LENEKIIHLIVLVESSHDAEMLASSFRNAGYAVRSKHVEDEEDLTAALQEKVWDLLIASPTVGHYTSVEAIECIKAAGKDIPCIVFGPISDHNMVLENIMSGAAYCVPPEEQELFHVIAQREFDNLRSRRALREARNMLTESEKRNRALIDSSKDAIAYIHEGMHIYANQSYLDLFGYEDMGEVEVMPIMDMISSQDQQKFKELLRTLSNGETPKEQFEFNAQRSNSEQFKAVMSFAPASIEGEPCTQIVIHQQGDNKELEKQLEMMRKQDLLTGLYNGQYFMEELNNAVTRASKGQGDSVLVSLEPDDFRKIKDELGIAGSDIVITDMANLLKENLGNYAIIARFADTVFTALFTKLPLEQIRKTMDKVRNIFEQHIFEVEGKSVTTTCSIGINPVTETSPDAKILMTQVEEACGIAKKDGGNKMHVHTIADQLASLEEDRAWIERIKLALKNNDFILLYQPIVGLHAEPGERYEVLLRMKGPEGKMYEPAEFMVPAENAKLMSEVDKWVMKNTAKAALEKRRAGKQIQFFVKLSGDSIEDMTLLTWISKLLKASRLQGNSFVFQVSERTLLHKLKNTKALVQGLKQLHCLTALTHVSNDPNANKHIAGLKPDYIKILGEYVQTLNTSESSQEAVKEISEAAQANNIYLIAEHVEDPTCLAVLWQHGINFIQGHYLQKPEPNMNYDFTSEE
jgi:diguanylate cyclase (GGDEF)-like protein/PAS domain S-box-containing protein